MNYLLVIPPQPAYSVGEQRSICCWACGTHFIERAGMGRLEPLPVILGQSDDPSCELRYDGVCTGWGERPS